VNRANCFPPIFYSSIVALILVVVGQFYLIVDSGNNGFVKEFTELRCVVRFVSAL